MQTLISKYQYYIQQTIMHSKTAIYLPVAAILIDSAGRVHYSNNNHPHHCEVNFAKHLYYQATIFVNLEPCPSCAFILQKNQVKIIVFGCYNMQYGACGGKFFLNNLCNGLYKTKIYGGICAFEALKVFKSRFKQILIQK